MPFSGKLGTANSALGNLELGGPAGIGAALTYAPEIYIGPPLRGAPWLPRLPHEFDGRPASLAVKPPPPPVYATEIFAGPPLRGAPWLGRLPGELLPPIPFVPPTSPAVSFPGAPIVARDPSLEGATRERRFTQILASIVNSLGRQGQLKQTGPDTWTIGWAILATRAPTASDDKSIGASPGRAWIDTVGKQIYFDISADSGAAVWSSSGSTGAPGPQGPPGPSPSDGPNTVFATPDGVAGAASLRALVANDIPALPESKITNLTSDLAAKADDSAVVHKAGTETITGTKNFTGRISSLPPSGGLNAEAFGGNAGAAGQFGIALGFSANAAGDYSCAIAATALASGPNSIAFGYSAAVTAASIGGIAFGSGAKCNDALNASAFGYNCQVNHNYSIVFGNSAQSTATLQVLLAAGITMQSSTGTAVQIAGNSSTAVQRAIADVDAEWASSTDATRKGRLALRVWDTAIREFIRGESDGGSPLVGFYGAPAVAKQSGDVGAALVNLGLMNSPRYSSSGLKCTNVAADVTTTSSTMADVTGLSFPIGASETWTVEFHLYATGSLGGMTFQLTGPASPNFVRVFTQGDTTGVTLISTDSQTAFGTPTQAYITAVFSGLVVIRATVENGPTAGTVKLQFAAGVNTQTNIVLRGSFMTAQRRTVTDLAYDNFTAANGTNLNGRTLVIGGTWTTQIGTYDIQTNKAHGSVQGSPGNQMVATTDVGQADYTISGIVNSAGSGSGVGLAVRYDVASSTFYFAQLESTTFTLYYYDGSNYNVVQSVSAGSPDLSADHTIVVVTNGANITATLDGVTVASTASGTHNQSSTLCGTRTSIVGALIDDLRVTTN